MKVTRIISLVVPGPQSIGSIIVGTTRWDTPFAILLRPGEYLSVTVDRVTLVAGEWETYG